MSFQKSAESWRAKLHLSGTRLPVLIGVSVVMVLVLVGAGKLLFDAATTGGFAVERSVNDEHDAKTPEKGERSEPGTTMFHVHVGGAVVASGVYEVPEGSRVYDVVEAAGGFAEGAAGDALNLAREITDGEQIIVPREADAAALQTGTLAAAPDASASKEAQNSAGGKVNINTASAAQLDALPGVGASTAQKIIADREANGPFKTVEDLKRVSGIGDKKFATLSDAISVG